MLISANESKISQGITEQNFFVSQKITAAFFFLLHKFARTGIIVNIYKRKRRPFCGKQLVSKHKAG